MLPEQREGRDRCVQEGKRDEQALAKAAAVCRAAANIRGKEDDDFACMYSSDANSECSSSGLVVDQKGTGACGGVLDEAASKLVASGKSPESAIFIVGLETPTHIKKRWVLDYGQVGMESSIGERTPVGKSRLEVDLKCSVRGQRT